MNATRDRLAWVRPFSRAAWFGTVLLVLSQIAAATDPEPLAVFRLMNERLSYMKDVALYKAIHHRPVEDVAREDVVMQRAAEAAMAKGLDPVSTAPFFEAQIAAAKVIQYRYRADWLSLGRLPEGAPRDLAGEVRPALLQLGNALTESIQSYLKAGGVFSEDWRTSFHEAIDVVHLTSRDKDNLFDSLAGIRLLE